MGKRGPAPQPTKLKLLKGDPSANLNEPRAREGTPDPPPEMGKEARAIWDYTTRELYWTGMLTHLDRDALVAYCEAVVTHRRACKMLAESEVLVRGRDGNIVKNPAIMVQRDAAMILKAFAAEFGLTPRARAEIHLPEGATSNDEERAAFGAI